MEPESNYDFSVFNNMITVNSRDLTAEWSIDNERSTNIEHELMKSISESIRQEIDNEVMIGLYKSMGMFLYKISPESVTEINQWCCLNLKHKWHMIGATFIFESQDDYSWFLLRWAGND